MSENGKLQLRTCTFHSPCITIRISIQSRTSNYPGGICAQTLAPTIPLLCLAFIYELFKSLMQSQQRKNLLNFAGFPFCSICMKSYAHGKQKETCHKTREMLKTAKRTTTSTSNRDYSAASA